MHERALLIDMDAVFVNSIIAGKHPQAPQEVNFTTDSEKVVAKEKHPLLIEEGVSCAVKTLT
jgi:hypothetical protein